MSNDSWNSDNAFFNDTEAKEKYCCTNSELLCKGSDCMAWRWTNGNPYTKKGGILLPRSMWTGYCSMTKTVLVEPEK